MYNPYYEQAKKSKHHKHMVMLIIALVILIIFTIAIIVISQTVIKETAIAGSDANQGIAETFSGLTGLETMFPCTIL